MPENQIIVDGSKNTTITGSIGDDVAIFAKAFSAYFWSVSTDTDGAYIRLTESATNLSVKIYGVERLQFADRSIGLSLGTAGPNAFSGTDSADIIYGAAGDDNAYGGASADTLWGGSGNDSLYGEGGDDSLGGNSGDDLLDGGAGEDIVDYSNTTAAVFVDLAAGTATGAGIGNDTLVSIEDINGSDYDDVIIGGSGDNFLIGRGGRDTIDGGANDTAFAADLADYRYAGSGIVANLATGIAQVTGDTNDVDTLRNLEGLSGSQYNDSLSGDEKENYFRGNRGNDTIDGAGGSDWVYYHRASGAVQVDLGAGTATGADGNDTLISIENIRGSQYSDLLTGSDQINFFRGLGGNDTIDGQAGFDWADYSQDVRYAGVSGIYANLAAFDLPQGPLPYGIAGVLAFAIGAGTVRDGFGSIDTLRNIENIRGTDFADFIIGSEGNNTFVAGGGNDTIGSGGGADLIDAGSGDDMIFVGLGGETIDGGTGIDIVYVDNGTQLLSLAQIAPCLTFNDDGSVRIAWPGRTETVLRNIEQLGVAEGIINLADLRRFGTAGNDSIDGTSAAETLNGYGGDDTLSGGGGRDSINGGKGNDLIYAGRPGVGPVNLVRNGGFEDYGVGFGGMGMFITPGGAAWIAQGRGVEIWNNFQGKAASEGSSYLELDFDYGYDGISQSLSGTVAGQKYYLSFDLSARFNYGGGGQERVEVSWNGAKLGTYGASSKAWIGFGLTVTATGNDVLSFRELKLENNSVGTHLDNISLTSLAPGATLSGGEGLDTLVGGDGADRFVFGAGDAGNALATADVLRAFQSGVDLVDVSALAPGKLWSFRNGGFTGSSDAEIAVSRVGTSLLASIDINGDKTADYALVFENTRSLTARDFGLS
jgi:Ca2+-binding RTX toxin-like protein